MTAVQLEPKHVLNIAIVASVASLEMSRLARLLHLILRV